MGHMQAIKDYLKVAGITQTELAKRSGVSVFELNNYIQGKREPRLKNLRKLSNVTGISIEKLVEGLGYDPE